MSFSDIFSMHSSDVSWVATLVCYLRV